MNLFALVGRLARDPEHALGAESRPAVRLRVLVGDDPELPVFVIDARAIADTQPLHAGETVAIEGHAEGFEREGQVRIRLIAESVRRVRVRTSPRARARDDESVVRDYASRALRGVAGRRSPSPQRWRDRSPRLARHPGGRRDGLPRSRWRYLAVCIAGETAALRSIEALIDVAEQGGEAGLVRLLRGAPKDLKPGEVLVVVDDDTEVNSVLTVAVRP